MVHASLSSQSCAVTHPTHAPLALHVTVMLFTLPAITWKAGVPTLEDQYITKNLSRPRWSSAGRH